MDTAPLRHRTAVLLLLVVLAVLGGCSSSGVDSADEAGSGNESAAGSLLTDSDSGAASREADEAGQERSIISKGVVALLGEDVAQARFDVQKIIDGHEGEIAEERTETDDDGAVSRSRLVVRVPVAEFDAAMEALETVAELESSSRNSQDVTTTVIDNEVRIRAQTESLKRIEVLLARARTIRDIITVEQQLTRRQADLDSLKSQQAYLADQTSLGTITVFLEQKPDPDEKKADGGFLVGLGSGWEALTSLAIGAATVAGVVLPFAVLFLVLGTPAWLLFRSLTRRRPAARDVAATPE